MKYLAGDWRVPGPVRENVSVSLGAPALHRCERVAAQKEEERHNKERPDQGQTGKRGLWPDCDAFSGACCDALTP